MDMSNSQQVVKRLEFWYESSKGAGKYQDQF